MNFKEVVEKTPDIAGAFKCGLSAVKQSERKSIIIKTPRLVDGSVDIDGATKALYANESRWDYVIGYDGKAYFVEVHPANTKNVVEMEGKLRWVQKWLEEHAKELNSYPCGNPRFLWAATHSGVHILKTSPEYRRAASLGIIPRFPQEIV